MQLLSAASPAYHKIMNTSLEVILEKNGFAGFKMMFFSHKPVTKQGHKRAKELPVAVCRDCQEYLLEYLIEVHGHNLSHGQRKILWNNNESSVCKDKVKGVVEDTSVQTEHQKKVSYRKNMRTYVLNK